MRIAISIRWLPYFSQYGPFRHAASMRPDRPFVAGAVVDGTGGDRERERAVPPEWRDHPVFERHASRRVSGLAPRDIVVAWMTGD
ncbi:protein of unknown function [Burkholderia multivorans]